MGPFFQCRWKPPWGGNQAISPLRHLRMIKSRVLRLKTIKGRVFVMGVSHVVGHITSVTPHVFSHRIRITSNLRKNRDVLNHFSFFQHPFTCFFPCVKKFVTKNGPTATDFTRVNLEWPATQQDHGFQDHYGRGCPLRLLPGKPCKRQAPNFFRDHSFPIFDKQQQVTRFCHLILGKS